MRRLILNFANLTVLLLISKAEAIIAAMTDNGIFPTPNPSLSVITVMINNLKQVQQQIDAGNYSLIELRDSNKAQLVEALCLLGFYVENTCAGDAVKLASSGFELTKTPESQGTPAIPESVSVTLGGVPGSVVIKWKPVDNARCYVVEATTQNPALPESVWQQLGICTKARFTCTGLTSAQYYSFRVCAVGSGQGNQSAPSEPATSIIG